MTKSVAFLVPYPFGLAPGPRFRFEQYLDALQAEGIRYRLFPFFTKAGYLQLYGQGNTFLKLLYTLRGYLLRVFQLLFVLWHYDYIFIYREATPLGYPFVEWGLARLYRKKIIYDFDDAIWLPTTSGQSKLVDRLKYVRKVPMISRWAHRVSAGNDYLAAHASAFRGKPESDPAVIYNPTTLDTENWHNRIKKHQEVPLTIGWTGSHSTLPYLEPLVPVIAQLEQKYDFRFRVICNQKPEFDLKSLEFVPWQKDSEIQDLLALHVGLMPLPDNAWAKGKCGFKALQYMSLGIPPVASPVGVNQRIIQAEKTGFLPRTEAEWLEVLVRLLSDDRLREKIGKAGRKTVVEHYSVQSNAPNFLNLFT